MDCSICFSESSKGYKCKNINCNTFTCNNCCNSFIDFCEKQIHTLPVCPSENCNQNIIFQNTRIISKDYLVKYSNLLFNFLKNDNNNELIIKKANDNIITSIKKERSDFISSTKYPAIIQFIGIALKDKMNKVNKSNIKLINKISSSNKKCFNITCNLGILNENFKCNICETCFCNKCHEPKIKGHVCCKKILESLKFLETIIKCPKCYTHIQKSEGCNDMTCAVCKTNFLYTTGELIKNGSHGNTNVNLKLNYKLSQEYKHDYPQDILNLLIEIESLEPDNPKFIGVLNLLDRILTDNNENLKLSLCRQYSLYSSAKQKQNLFFKALKEINYNHTKQKLTIELLNEILDTLH